MANRGTIRLAYNDRRLQWFSNEPFHIQKLEHVDLNMFVQRTKDCESFQSPDNTVISYYREKEFVGRATWVEDETLFQLMM